MEAVHDKSNLELYKSLLAETAKTLNEVRCARQDLEKVASRLSFNLVVINELIDREAN